jgi:hypothetical protein
MNGSSGTDRHRPDPNRHGVRQRAEPENGALIDELGLGQLGTALLLAALRAIGIEVGYCRGHCRISIGC